MARLLDSASATETGSAAPVIVVRLAGAVGRLGIDGRTERAGKHAQLIQAECKKVFHEMGYTSARSEHVNDFDTSGFGI